MHYNGNFVTVKITSVNKRLIKMYNKWPSAALSVQQKRTGVGGGKGVMGDAVCRLITSSFCRLIAFLSGKRSRFCRQIQNNQIGTLSIKLLCLSIFSLYTSLSLSQSTLEKVLFHTLCSACIKGLRRRLGFDPFSLQLLPVAHVKLLYYPLNSALIWVERTHQGFDLSL